MSKFQRDEFIKFVVDNHVVGFFDHPVKLRSGRESHWYANWRTLAGDVFLVDRLSDFLIDFLEENRVHHDIIYGVPDGATKIGLITQYKWASRQSNYKRRSHVLLMGRGSPKEHGVAKDRLFLGDPKGKVAVVEDVTTTGGSLIRAIEGLIEAGVKVAAAVGLTNRMEKRSDGRSVAEAVAALDVPYYSMSDANELLPWVFEQATPNYAIKRAVIKEFEEYGVEPLIEVF
jgi:orotate phosphoribosyltransferase